MIATTFREAMSENVLKCEAGTWSARRVFIPSIPIPESVKLSNPPGLPVENEVHPDFPRLTSIRPRVIRDGDAVEVLYCDAGDRKPTINDPGKPETNAIEDDAMDRGQYVSANILSRLPGIADNVLAAGPYKHLGAQFVFCLAADEPRVESTLANLRLIIAEAINGEIARAVKQRDKAWSRAWASADIVGNFATAPADPHAVADVMEKLKRRICDQGRGFGVRQ